MKYMDCKQNAGGITDGDTALSLLEMRDHSIALYCVIMCCNWAGREAFDYPDHVLIRG